MLAEIKSWVDGQTLHSLESDSLKSAIEFLVKQGAYLAGAYLARAKLAGAIYSEGVILTKIPICVSGLTWDVVILDSHMKIGCELHSFSEWESFTETRIKKMESRALDWWRQHKTMLFAIIDAMRPGWREGNGNTD